MSMYALLRNHQQPSEEQLLEALGGRADMHGDHHPPEARRESCFRLLGPTHEVIPVPNQGPPGCF